MAFPPHASGTVVDSRDQRAYQCHLYRPHLLTLAINERWPKAATCYAVNIGAGDGKACEDPVFPLYQSGFAGLAVEASDQPALFANLPSTAIIKRTNTFITPDSAGQLLRDAHCPVELDFLKVDIDGYDGPILKAILSEGFRPKVIQMEVNPEFPPPIEFAVLYHPGYRGVDAAGHVGGFYGASVGYVARVAIEFGYSICYIDFVTPYTHDVTLVRNDFRGAASEVFGLATLAQSPREIFLGHPVGYSHFREHGVDSYGWRYRTDYQQMLGDVWQACMRSNLIKHGDVGVPFHLSV